MPSYVKDGEFHFPMSALAIPLLSLTPSVSFAVSMDLK